MDKELPKMYRTKINKPITSIQKIYRSNDNSIGNDSNYKYSNISIDKKINNIFNSYDYVYKADVTIVTDNEIFEKRIIARNNNNLITIDNESIPINIIRDIYK
jgi:hypothetical protein